MDVNILSHFPSASMVWSPWCFVGFGNSCRVVGQRIGMQLMALGCALRELAGIGHRIGSYSLTSGKAGGAIGHKIRNVFLKLSPCVIKY